MSGVQTLTIQPNDNQIVLTRNPAGSGNYVITNSIPVYYGSAYGGIEKLNTTQPGDTIGTQEFRANYNNLDVSTGLTIQTTTNPPPPGSTLPYNTYTLSADLAGVEAGPGITVTDDIGNVKIISTDIVGFIGSGGVTNPTYGITFSDPDVNGIVTVTPAVGGIVPGVGIGVIQNVSPFPTQPNLHQIRATVADVVEGDGIEIQSNPLTGVYQVAATVGDILPGPGIDIEYGQGSTYTLGLNLSQPTASGIDYQINNVGDFTLKATYQNLTTTEPGLTITRTAGDMVTPPSANLVANVSSLATTGIGIATTQDTVTNQWTINNTGILAVQAGTNMTVTTTNGVATVNYAPSTTFGSELILDGSIQVPTIVGGKTQGSHFNVYTMPQTGGQLGQSLQITGVQPTGTAQGAFYMSYTDTTTSNTNNSFVVLMNSINGPMQSPLVAAPNLNNFQFLTLNQLTPTNNFLSGNDFVCPGLFTWQSNPTVSQAAGLTMRSGEQGIVSFSVPFGLNGGQAKESTGIAFNSVNLYSIITTTTGLDIGTNPFGGSGIGEVIPSYQLTTTGSYRNPVITRQYNRSVDTPANIANASRGRCFCTEENGGLVEIPMTFGAPYFAAPVIVPNSPVGTGWYPLTVVPLDDQWAILPAPVPTTKFNYLIYLSNDSGTSVYNTLTQLWQTYPVGGPVSSFYNSNLVSIAPANDTIYSQFYGGALLRSDMAPDVVGQFPTFTGSSQTSSLLFPVGLNYNDCTMFVSWDRILLTPTGPYQAFARVYQSTFTPDFSEYVGNSIQIKALDFLQLQTEGDCQINSGSLELTNEAVTVNSGIVDLFTDSLSVNTGSIDLQTGTSVNLSTGTSLNLTAGSSITGTTVLNTVLTSTSNTIDFSTPADTTASQVTLPWNVLRRAYQGGTYTLPITDWRIINQPTPDNPTPFATGWHTTTVQLQNVLPDSQGIAMSYYVFATLGVSRTQNTPQNTFTYSFGNIQPGSFEFYYYINLDASNCDPATARIYLSIEAPNTFGR
jgi:hypothetical protein